MVGGCSKQAQVQPAATNSTPPVVQAAALAPAPASPPESAGERQAQTTQAEAQNQAAQPQTPDISVEEAQKLFVPEHFQDYSFPDDQLGMFTAGSSECGRLAQNFMVKLNAMTAKINGVTTFATYRYNIAREVCFVNVITKHGYEYASALHIVGNGTSEDGYLGDNSVAWNPVAEAYLWEDGSKRGYAWGIGGDQEGGDTPEHFNHACAYIDTMMERSR